MYRIYSLAALVLALAATTGVAQQADEPVEKPADAKESKTASDVSKAEKLLKRAYTRVHSAESEGLTKLFAIADIEVDASAFGFGKLAFPGELSWKSGGTAAWESTAEEEEGGARNPLSRVTDTARQLFEPYLAYVAGFEAWDVRFKDAKFKLLEPEAADKTDAETEAETGKVELIEVTYKDGRIEHFRVAKNSVLSFTKDGVIDMGTQEQKVKVTFGFEYEDLGKTLRPKKVTGSTEIEMPEMPGDNDPKNPGKAPVGGGKDTLTGSITVEKWGRAGTYDIAVELKGSVALKSLGVEFPATLKLSEVKVNEGVKDVEADKPEADAPEAPDVPKKTPESEDEKF